MGLVAIVLGKAAGRVYTKPRYERQHNLLAYIKDRLQGKLFYKLLSPANSRSEIASYGLS